MFSPKRGTGKASQQGSQRLMQAREILASLFNIKKPEQIAFTSGCTQALNTAIQAFPWQSGDGVIMSAVEHHALSRPIRKMAAEKGIAFFLVPYSENNPFDLDVYQQLLEDNPAVKLVATTHASNVIGSVLPIAAIAKRAKAAGKLYLLDAAQSAGVLPVDVQSLGIDMMAVPGHKSLYGPPGIGALYVNENVPLSPFIVGGTGNDSGKHAIQFKMPDAIETGSIPLPQILAFADGVKWVSETGLSTIHAHEIKLLKRLIEQLQVINGVTLYGHTDLSQKTPVLSFKLDGHTVENAGKILASQYGIALRTGFHCAPMAHEALGTIAQGGTIRASIGYFNTADDIDALVAAIKEMV